MVRLDDNELNISREVAAALGHLRPELVEQEVQPRIRTERPAVAEGPSVGSMDGAEIFVQILSWIFGAAVLFVIAVLVVAILGWLYVLFTTTPQQGQLGTSQALGAVTVAHSHTHRSPRRAPLQHRRHRTTASPRLSAHRKMSRPKSAYLPPAVDAPATGKIKSPHSSDFLSLHRLKVQRSPRQRAGTTLIHKPPAIPRQHLSRNG